jgi:predicted DNA-binding protein
MTVSIQWSPEEPIRYRLNTLAQQRGESPEEIITEAVQQYLESEIFEYVEERDPLVDLFSSSKNLASNSEEMLQPIDRRDFQIFRPNHCGWFELLS